MSVTDNLWFTTWNAAEAVPVSRQPPLMQYEKEAAKVLHYLETLSPGDLLEQLIGVCVTGMFYTLSSTPLLSNESTPETLAFIENCIAHVNSNWTAGLAFEECDVISDSVCRAELIVAELHSLGSKVPNQARLASRVVSSHHKGTSGTVHVPVLKGEEEDAVLAFFESSSYAVTGLGDVDAEEFIVRTSCAHPSTHHRTCGSRLYAHRSGGEFRLCTALSSDDGW